MSLGNHALVFGASGLAGWAVVEQLLNNYPGKDTFSKVTASVNRSLTREVAYWPRAAPDQPAFQFIPGIDLSRGSVDEFTRKLREAVPEVEQVTHVYYFIPAYKQESEWDEEVKVNGSMLSRVVGALDSLAPGLRFIAFPSGTRGYGISIPGGLHKPPLVEAMDPLPEPYRSQIFYYAYQDILRQASQGKDWTWCELRPDAIIGFAPSGSTYNLTAHWATYLSAFAHIEGPGAKVPFPGSHAGYTSLSNDASATMLARASIWASLHPDKTAGQLFNVADQATPKTMRERWLALAAYFGLEGAGPAGDDPHVLRPGEYCKKHANVLEAAGVKAQVFQGEFLDTVGYYLSFDRHMSLDKIRAAGFDEERDSNESWFEAFDRFKAAGMLMGRG